jgi:hypothetical protein
MRSPEKSARFFVFSTFVFCRLAGCDAASRLAKAPPPLWQVRKNPADLLSEAHLGIESKKEAARNNAKHYLKQCATVNAFRSPNDISIHVNLFLSAAALRRTTHAVL